MLSRFLFYLGVYIGKPIIKALFSLNRCQVLNPRFLADALDSGSPVLVCSWHGRLLFPFYFLRDYGAYAVAGLHPDAEIISRLGARMGWKMIRGSSTKGGVIAYQRLVDVLSKEGSLVAITPDGPTGPERRAKPGTVRAAMLTGAVVVPVSGQATRRWEFENWDTLVVPKPWGRVWMVFGQPVEIDGHGSFDENNRRFEAELNRAERIADAAALQKT